MFVFAQKLPDHPLPWMSAGVPPTIGFGGRGQIGQAVLVQPQHQPWNQHPLPWVSAGVPPTIGFGPGNREVVRWLIVGPQERPSTAHPLPMLHPGVRPLLSASSGVVGQIVQGQYTPLDHPRPVLLQTEVLYGLNVRSPVADYLFVPQHTPRDHPLPRLASGPVGQNARVPVTDTILVRQEQPSHPLPVVGSSPQTQRIGPPIVNYAIVRQEQPGHPPPTLASGPVGQILAPPFRGMLIQGHYVPLDHPRSFVNNAVFVGQVSPPDKKISIFVAQEQPGHPLPVLRPGKWPDPPFNWPVLQGTGLIQFLDNPALPIQPVIPALPPGRTVRPPTVDYTLVRQEQPGHPPSFLGRGDQSQNIRPPVADTILVRQEQPGHPLPQVQHGVVGPNVRAPTTSTVAVSQEQPWHPTSVLWPGVAGSSVITKVVDFVFVRQEQPGHPLPALGPSPQSQNIRPAIDDTILVRQEQPGHPSPILVSPLQTGNVTPITEIGRILVFQEQPGHPLPIMRPGGNPIPVFVPSVTSSIIVRQQAPDHPAPGLQPGVPGVSVPRVFVQGRTVVIRPDSSANIPYPYLEQFAPSTPADSDPYTADLSKWLSLVSGDTISSVVVSASNQDGTTQTDVMVTSPIVGPTGTMVTVWIAGGVAGKVYLVTFVVQTASGRHDSLSVALPIVAARS